jgi:hypothetical protein
MPYVTEILDGLSLFCANTVGQLSRATAANTGRERDRDLNATHNF